MPCPACERLPETGRTVCLSCGEQTDADIERERLERGRNPLITMVLLFGTLSIVAGIQTLDRSFDPARNATITGAVFVLALTFKLSAAITLPGYVAFYRSLLLSLSVLVYGLLVWSTAVWFPEIAGPSAILSLFVIPIAAAKLYRTPYSTAFTIVIVGLLLTLLSLGLLSRV